MQIYQVGGSVRDELLGLPVVDRDFVVVGSTPEEMVSLGYLPVGKEFPVFLHPKTREEYALARTERKQGHGYHGFQFFTSPSITIEEDLFRRDLTVNAIAKDKSGCLIDPCHGIADLSNRVFRHVSSAFVEDPVRILRLARFLARFTEFRVADETRYLAERMVAEGETAHLVSERVWQEISRGLLEARPDRMIHFLDEIKLLPGLLFSSAEYWKESHVRSIEKLLNAAADKQADLTIRIAVLCFQPAVPYVDDCQAFPLKKTGLRLPKQIQEFMDLFNATWASAVKMFTLGPEALWRLLRRIDPIRRADRFQRWLAVMELYDQYQPTLSNREQTIQTLVDAAESLNSFQGKKYRTLNSVEIAAIRQQHEIAQCAKHLSRKR